MNMGKEYVNKMSVRYKHKNQPEKSELYVTRFHLVLQYTITWISLLSLEYFGHRNVLRLVELDDLLDKYTPGVMCADYSVISIIKLVIICRFPVMARSLYNFLQVSVNNFRSHWSSLSRSSLGSCLKHDLQFIYQLYTLFYQMCIYIGFLFIIISIFVITLHRKTNVS